MIYEFDNHTVDTDTRALSYEGATVTLTPKVFQILILLLENHHRIMSKEELFEAIWPETVVEESNLTQNISVLRRALREAECGKKYIGTFPGHGYRFLEPVHTNLHREQSAALSVASEKLPPTAAQGNDQAHPASSSSHPPRSVSGNPKRGAYLLTLASVACLLSIFLLVMVIRSSKRRPEPHLIPAMGIAPRTLSRLPGSQYQPSWSPDGKYLAFVYSSPNESQSIVIESIGDMQQRRMVSGPGQYSSPVWSPDGKFLAYIHMESGAAEIVILNISQSTSRVLANLFPHRYGLNCRHLDWSPDGMMLVVDDKNLETDPLSLYLVYVRNGYKLRLTYPNFDVIGDVAPRFSPDGTQVAFIRIKYQYDYDVFVLPATGGVCHKLTNQFDLVGDIDWETPRSIIFSGRHDGEFRFWRQDLRSPKIGAVLASPIASDVPLQFSILRRSQKIAFSAYRPNLDIWALSLSKKPYSDTDWTPVIRSPDEDTAPSFSPDGSRISFRSDISGKVQIWISRADGSGAFPVNTGALIPGTNCWGHDSDSVVFSTRSGSGLYEASPLRNPGVRQITSANISHPFYSVDGKWIFVRIGNIIYRLPSKGGSAQRITEEGGAPILQSRDGRYLYFAHGRMNTTISRFDLLTNQQRMVVHSLIPGYSEDWALTPLGIVFLTELEGRPVIAFHDFATGKERKIAEFAGTLPPVGASGFSISRDGRRLLAVRADPASANIQTAMLTEGINAN